MGRYIKVVASTAGGAVAGQPAWSNLAIVGRAVGSGFTLNKPYWFNSANEAKSVFGETSALYKSILKLYENGASTVIGIAADVAAQTQAVFNGTGAQTEFVLAEIPAMPLDEVTVGAVPQVEGVDFVVDYGNKKVIFTTPPPVGVGNVLIDFSKHTVALIQDALEALEEVIDIQILVGAMIFEQTLLAEFKSHCDAMEAVDLRTFVFMGKKGESDLSTLVTALAGYKNWIVAHNSMEDAASIYAGRIAGLRPWVSPTKKDLRGLNQDFSLRFNTTQQTNFDALQVAFTHDPPKDNLTAWVVSKAWTLDTTGNLLTIDRVRTLFFMANVLEWGLTGGNVIGTMKMNLNGLEELNSYIESLLQPWVQAGAINGFTIDNPAHVLFAKTRPTAADVQNKNNLQQVPRLEGAYALKIGINYSGAIEFIELEVTLGGE